MNNKTKKIMTFVLVVFLIIQPLCDIYMGVIGEKLDIFGISIVTFVRTITVTVLFLAVGIYQIKHKYKTKWLMTMGGYILAVLIYALFHHLNISLGDGYYIKENIYNALIELLYILRLLLPVVLIYVVAIINPDKEKIEKGMLIAILIVSLIIVTTNILKLSYASYSPKNKIITYNIFDWFKYDDLSYRTTLSKGFFVSANQIGALLVVILPLTIYHILRWNKKYTYLILLLQGISMIMVGTRVATYGLFICSFAMLIGYIVLSILVKAKMNLGRIVGVCLVILFCWTVYKQSPSNSRTFASANEDIYIDLSNTDNVEVEDYTTIEVFNEIVEDEDKMREYINAKNQKDLTIEELKYKTMCKYIRNNYKMHSIAKKYIMNIYPYEQDPEFWVNLFNEPVSVKGDSRVRQTEIIKRIKKLNENVILDTLLGMGATPMNSREYMIENDIISHYYNIGIIGMIIFVAPYLAAAIYIIVIGIKNYEEIFNARLMTYALSICMMYVVGYFAGHVIDEYIVTIYMAVISGMLLNVYNEEKRGIDEFTKA